MDEDTVRILWKIYGKDIIRDVDGYFVYWPRDAMGFLSEANLRTIADLLKLVNTTWDTKLEVYFTKHHPPVAPEGF